MPKHNNRAGAISNRLTRRLTLDDQKRSDLLAKILEESSSITLNDASSQPSAKQTVERHSKLFDLIEELRLVEGDIRPELASRSEESWKRFFEWVDAKSESKLSESIGVSRLQSHNCVNGTNAPPPSSGENQTDLADYDDEFALIAKVPFKRGDKVFSIDRSMMLTTETAIKDSDLFDFIKRDSIASGMQNVVLVLHLLNEYSKREQSYWWPYLSILPKKILPALDMDRNSLQYLLPSAHIFETLKMIRAIARQYSYFFKCLQSTKLPLRKDFTFSYYAWGVSIVCSRQNEIPTLNRQACSAPVVHALIPVLDMCNHSLTSSQATFENNSSCLVASNDLQAFDEININYGCRSSGDFFIHNGFVPVKVPYDVVPLTIVLSKQDSSYGKRAKLLKILNMPTFGRFKLIQNDYENRHKRDPHLTMFLIVNSLTEQELDLIMASNNPVGIADEIYEYIQYSNYCNENGNEKSNTNSSSSSRQVQLSDGNLNQNNNSMEDANNETKEVQLMKSRLSRCLREYLSKRCTICVALIDRIVSSFSTTNNEKEAQLPAAKTSQYFAILKLLARERAVYESYIIKQETSNQIG